MTHICMAYCLNRGPRLTLKVCAFTSWGHLHRVAHEGDLLPSGAVVNWQLLGGE